MFPDLDGIKLEINNWKVTENLQTLGNNNKWKYNIGKVLDTAEAVLRWKFMALSTYIIEEEESQWIINSHLKNLEKGGKCRKKKIIKIRA